MKAHVFRYKFPLNKIDLIHEEHPRTPSATDVPNGAYCYDGNWMRTAYNPSFRRVVWNNVDADRIPKEIRVWALLLCH